MAVLTRHDRQIVQVGIDFEWSSDLWTHNVFRLYELVFGRRYGIRKEVSSAIDKEGRQWQMAHTWEAACALTEVSIREAFRFRLPVMVWIPLMQTPQGIPVLAFPYLLAIAADATSDSGVGVTTNPLTWTHVVTGSNPYVFAAARNASNPPRAITAFAYNSVSGTVIEGFTGDGNGFRSTGLCGLVNPSTGSHSLSITQAAAPSNWCVAIGASYSGVRQDSAGTGGTDSSNTSEFISTSTSMTLACTTVDNNCILVAALSMGENAITASTNTEIVFTGSWTQEPSWCDSPTAQTPAGSHSLSVTLNSGTSEGYFLMAAIAPVASAAVVTPVIPASIIMFN